MRKAKLFGVVAAAALSLTAVFMGGEIVKAQTDGADKIASGVYVGGVDVSGMTAEEATAAIDEYMNQMMSTNFSLVGVEGSVSVTAEDMGVYADTETAVTKALAVTHSGSLINRYKETKDLQAGNTVTIDLGLAVDKQATANLIYSNRLTLNREAQNASLTRENGEFIYVPGKSGCEVEIVPSVYAINDFLANEWDMENNDISLVTVEVEPMGTQEELALIKDCIGSFSTDFSTSSKERATNVKNGCSKINGSILYPGEEFSVYATVSPFVKENGYELAGAYQNGATIESFGGGICQVATTLYNAVLRAELDVTQRYNHSMLVSYVSPSDDAAIAGTYKDMRFVNNTETPIYIEGYCSGGIITFNIYGVETRPSNRKVSYVSETISQADATFQANLDGSQKLGYWHTEQSAHKATVAQLWKVVTVDGVQESKTLVNKSTYMGSPKIVTIGVAGATPEQMAAINAALATNDEATIRATVHAAAAGEGATPSTPETPQTPEPVVPETPAENPPAENPPAETPQE